MDGRVEEEAHVPCCIPRVVVSEVRDVPRCHPIPASAGCAQTTISSRPHVCGCLIGPTVKTTTLCAIFRCQKMHRANCPLSLTEHVTQIERPMLWGADARTCTVCTPATEAH